jgi:hypothetical protein
MTESLERLIVRFLIIVSELSCLTGPIRGSVLGTMAIWHVFALVRELCGTDQEAEALEHGFHWSLLRALYRIRLGWLARLDHGRKRRLQYTRMPGWTSALGKPWGPPRAH